MYVVVMAGGGGTRLHPLSTPGRPKPFLPLLGDRTLLGRTVGRLFEGPELTDAGLSRADVVVVAAAAYAPLVAQELPDITILAEPVGRNTAAAIALAAVAIDREPDEVMIVLPADHTIEREAVFRSVLAAAGEGLACGAFGVERPLVTLGIQPDHPATEYGYLRPEVERGARIAGLDAYPLRAFLEKPDRVAAESLVAEPGTAWNAGIFLWRRDAILDAFRSYAPDILATVEAGVRDDDLAPAYETVRATSIDYAVMEPAGSDGRVLMAAMDVGWSDLGGWTALLEALGVPGEGRVVRAGQSIEAGAADLIVQRRGGHLVLETGPAEGILEGDEPIAVLAGASVDRATIETLLARCTVSEADL